MVLASLLTTHYSLLTTHYSLLTTHYLLCTYLGLCLCDAVRLSLKVSAPPVLELQLLQGALQRRTHALVLTPVLSPLLAPVLAPILAPVRLALVGLGLARSRDGPAARRALTLVRMQTHLRDTLAKLGHLDVHLGESGEQVSRYVGE